MNVSELQRCLLEENFPFGSYSLSGEHLDGAYVLKRSGDRYIVEYTERSLACFVAEFAVEDDVCEFFLKKMRQLVPNRKDFSGHA